MTSERGSDFVFVTVEEVELSLSSVVALPADKTDEDGLVLEARVRASEQVANVHELALLQRASLARRLSRQLSGQLGGGGGAENDDDLFDAKRREELEETLRSAWAPLCETEASEADADELAAAANVDVVKTYLRRRGRGAALSGCERRLPTRNASRKDLSEAQARKDIERDSVVVRVKETTTTPRVQRACSAAAYESVVASIADAQRTLVRRADASEWRPVDDADLRALAKAALRVVNRTESGGHALETLAHLLPPCLTPVPDSKRAEPLRIDLSLGPAVDPTEDCKYPWRWGLRANVEGSTLYRLFQSDSDFDSAVAVARATYSNFLILPLDSLDKHNKRGPLGGGGGGGDDDDDDKKNLEQDDLSPGGPRVLYDRDKAKVAIHISLADGVP
eukprot:CAMPEP_0118913554 /NCGR_PEP_ID=MMETSP1166-20130328/14314_1 /TAXON_ID=1104430 /ORGANISM="Chrysoreinhardia sp, Strain CCMP3193" /LENGTH=393 /DNA_ID=CAMNT_0006853117 /DNA_START=79 /DNA_END=1260 /DNA_ORIENTATION=-